MALSHGQLSVLRAIEKLPEERIAEAHLGFTIDLDPSSVPPHLDQALAALSGRHEGLRVVFDRLRSDDPRQRVLDVAEPEVLGVRQSAVDLPAEAAFFDSPFDLEHTVGWRCRLVDGADGARVDFCIHHMLADGESLGLLERELTALLADPGAALPGAGSLRALVREEEASRDRTQQETRRYWGDLAGSGALRAATAPAGSHSLPGRRHVGLLLPVPTEGLEAWSRRHRLLPSTVPMVAACLSTMLANRSLLPVLTLMYNNRWDSTTKDVVASLNQVLPVTAEVTAETTWMEFMKGLQLAGLAGIRHARYDVDEAARLIAAELREERELDIFYNYLADADPTSVMRTEPWTPGQVHALPVRRQSGPPIDIRALGRTNPLLTVHFSGQSETEAAFTSALEETSAVLSSVMSSTRGLGETLRSTLPTQLPWP
ncbi:condensation domain-containing protein [Nocardioides sp. LML1-1-1.1]|uniref:condensation domain-containing protein n=1 Tax=Nocardioides sp. LML1-1-1.1 TaxID=3135248 RepID=UPI0034266C25